MDPVQIANQALGELGEFTVTAVDGSDPSVAGQLLGQQYEALRDKVTEIRDWTFATKRFLLTMPDGTPPAFGYAVRFPLDQEVLRVITCEPGTSTGAPLDAFAAAMALDEGMDPNRLDWVKEDRFVLVKQAVAAVNMKAIVKVPDPTIWSPGFGDAVSARVAAALCVPLTADKSHAIELWKLYQEKLKEAAANDGRGAGRSQVRRSSTLAMRRR